MENKNCKDRDLLLRMAYFGLGISNLFKFDMDRVATIKETGEKFTLKELEKILYGK